MFTEMMPSSGGGGGSKLYAACGPIANNNGYIECGFRPKKINFGNGDYNPSQPLVVKYDESVSSTSYTRIYDGSYWNEAIDSNNFITSIDGNGFIIKYPTYFQSSSSWVVVEG